MGRTYRTAQGKNIDLEKLKLQHELVQAVGNMRVNARGDQLGAGGEIVQAREEMVNQHYRDNVVKRRNVAKEDVIPTQAGKVEDVKPSTPAPKLKKKQPAPRTKAIPTPEPTPEPEVVETAPEPEVVEQPNNTYVYTGDSEETLEIEPTPEKDKISGVSKGGSALKGGLARAVAKTQDYENKKNKPKRI
jgi:outer membrane biosynthesis protein TonB